MSRTMSGIPTSSGGDVKLDGNPNAFTGTNSFNINLPTSSLTTTTANDEFITKAIGDTIYGSGTGDAILSGGSAAVPQQFTGFNVFTNEIEQKDNSTDINSFRQTENSTAVGAGNFIEQDGVGKGHITQQADNSVIRQNGNDTQIIQGTATTTGAVFKQEGDDAEIKQEGIGVEFKQSSTFAAATPNIISTTGFVRTGQAPAIGDDCVNLTYFNANAGTGDALLAGGLTELNPQEFTGFNNFTKDTHFDENIDADDQIRMNGSSAQFKIAAFSMTSGDTATGNGGNTWDQQNAGFYGNSIYQISGPIAPLLPAANTCVFHQTGLTDIIRTEGKAQARLAPVVGEDLCNKTYVDATAGGGGSFIGFNFGLATNYYSPSPNQILNWAIPATNPNQVAFTEPASLINSFSSGTFTATANEVGYWKFSYAFTYQTVVPSQDSLTVQFQKILVGGAIQSLAFGFQSKGVQAQYKQQNGSLIVKLALGEGVNFKLQTAPYAILGADQGQFSRWVGVKL